MHVKRGKRDKSSESGGQASGGSRLDWCATTAECIIQTSPLLSFSILSSSHVNEPRHSIWRQGWRGGGGGEEKDGAREMCEGVKHENKDGEGKWDVTGKTERLRKRKKRRREQASEVDEQSW